MGWQRWKMTFFPVAEKGEIRCRYGFYLLSGAVRIVPLCGAGRELNNYCCFLSPHPYVGST